MRRRSRDGKVGKRETREERLRTEGEGRVRVRGKREGSAGRHVRKEGKRKGWRGRGGYEGEKEVREGVWCGENFGGEGSGGKM